MSNNETLKKRAKTKMIAGGALLLSSVFALTADASGIIQAVGPVGTYVTVALAIGTPMMLSGGKWYDAIESVEKFKAEQAARITNHEVKNDNSEKEITKALKERQEMPPSLRHEIWR